MTIQGEHPILAETRRQLKEVQRLLKEAKTESRIRNLEKQVALLKRQRKSFKKFNGKVYTFRQGPGPKRDQIGMGKLLKKKRTIRSYRVVKGEDGYLLYTR